MGKADMIFQSPSRDRTRRFIATLGAQEESCKMFSPLPVTGPIEIFASCDVFSSFAPLPTAREPCYKTLHIL